MMKKVVVLTLILCVALPATPQTQPEPLENLQVFDKNISRDDLIKAMKGFTRGLGVRCNHCHVVTATEPREQFDFPSDAKETKRAARVMIQMVMQINGTHMPRLAEVEGKPEAPRVACWTCHRGKEEPEDPPPPPQQPQS